LCNKAAAWVQDRRLIEHPRRSFVMEDKQRRGFHSRLRWTLGSLMIVVAVSALFIALVRPFVPRDPPSGEVIGISFDLVETRSPDGRPVMGLFPKTTITKKLSENLCNAHVVSRVASHLPIL
jgi:hypothetical protein